MLSLIVVRMAPVAIALARRGARLPTLAFIGWFGPRGVASIVFGLLLVESGAPEADTLLAVVTATVTLSVFAHGHTSAPLDRACRRWYAGRSAANSDAAEAKPTTRPRLRRQLKHADARILGHQAGDQADDVGRAASPSEAD